MSFHTEHQRLKPVLDLARQFDIASNPDPRAIFEAGSGGFQVWCLPTDHPKGWKGIAMTSGTFSKPCAYVGSAHWKWEDERIVGIEIETSAYALAEQWPQAYTQSRVLLSQEARRTIFNRPDDIEWLKEKITWLFTQAGVALPPFEHEQTPLSEPLPHTLAHYRSGADEYVVIVSPARDPQEFCRAGYALVHSLEIWRADDFPADVILRPEDEYCPVEVEPDEGPLVEQYENASRLGDDDWLEACYEDRISGWDE